MSNPNGPRESLLRLWNDIRTVGEELSPLLAAGSPEHLRFLQAKWVLNNVYDRLDDLADRARKLAEEV